MNTITVRLFGAFRSRSADSEIRLEIPPRATPGDVKAALAERLGLSPSELVASSALADERRILAPGDPIPEGARLAILPPVCGG